MLKSCLKIIAVASTIVFTLLIETKTLWGVDWEDLDNESQLRVLLFHARNHEKTVTYKSYMPSHGSLNGLKQRTENDLIYIIKPSINEDKGYSVEGVLKKVLIEECRDCTLCFEKMTKIFYEIQKIQLLQGIREALSAQSVLLNNRLEEMNKRFQGLESKMLNPRLQISEESKEE